MTIYVKASTKFEGVHYAQGQIALADDLELRMVQSGVAYDINSKKKRVGPVSAIGDPIVTSRILNPHKCERMFAKAARSAFERVHFGMHGMSVPFGVGSENSLIYTGGGLGRTRSVTAVMSKVLNAYFGGVMGIGFDAAINGVWTVAGGAAFSSAFASAGPEGRCITLGAGTASITISGGYANQKVRIFAYAVPAATPGTPIAARYAMAGSNVQALIDAPISAGAPLMANGLGHWYPIDLNLPFAGNTTITLQNPAAGGTVVIFGGDTDFRSDAGITIDRLCRAGTGLTDCCAWALDDTDVKPAGNWTTTGTVLQRQQRRDDQFNSMTSQIGVSGVFCWFDINMIMKSLEYGYTLNDHKRHINNYIAKVNGAGLPIMFIDGLMRDPASVIGLDHTQVDIMNLFNEASDASNDVVGASVIDLSTTIYGATAAQKNAEQWRDSLYVTENENPPVHPNMTGHAVHGNTLGHSFISAYSKL
jgi:hypothetical protein